MKRSILAICISFVAFLTSSSYAATLSEEAKLRGINSVCQTHLEEAEKSFKLNGLNLTFFHNNEPSAYPSFHTSTAKFENGASFFSTSLSPDGDLCYISIVNTTIVNNQTCAAILKARLNNDPTLTATLLYLSLPTNPSQYLSLPLLYQNFQQELRIQYSKNEVKEYLQ